MALAGMELRSLYEGEVASVYREGGEEYEIRVHTGGEPITVPYFRSYHGPIISPFPYNPEDPGPAIVSYAYAHWGRELKSVEAFLKLARAESLNIVTRNRRTSPSVTPSRAFSSGGTPA